MTLKKWQQKWIVKEQALPTPWTLAMRITSVFLPLTQAITPQTKEGISTAPQRPHPRFLLWTFHDSSQKRLSYLTSDHRKWPLIFLGVSAELLALKCFFPLFLLDPHPLATHFITIFSALFLELSHPWDFLQGTASLPLNYDSVNWPLAFLSIDSTSSLGGSKFAQYIWLYHKEWAQVAKAFLGCTVHSV